MNYFSRELSQKLQKLGCVSENDQYWGPRGLMIFTEGDIGDIKAFSWPDLCLPENAKKVWSEENKPIYPSVIMKRWDCHRHAIIDLLPDYDAIEKYVLLNMKGSER